MTFSSETHHDWEFSKENAAPLQCGRSTKSLSRRAFGTSTAETDQIEIKTKKYERLVRRSEKAVDWLQSQSKRLLERAQGDGVAVRDLTEDEAQTLRNRLVTELGFDPSASDRENIDYDPMRYWVLYIKHIRESHPSDSQRQFLLMERCARTFMARPFIIPSYQNDPRFIRTCILYADKTSSPSEVFKLMSRVKVGTKVSLFWVAWAWVAEKSEDFQFTEKIFQKALSVGAEPRKFLEDRQRQFLRRMSRHWLNASQAQENGLSDEEEEDGTRGALNSLASADVARNHRTSTFNRHAQLQQQNVPSRLPSRQTQQRSRNETKPKGGFSIFRDHDPPRDVLHDDENAPGGRQRLVKDSERTKENCMRPERWNERGYGVANPVNAALSEALSIGTDSIVGTVREPAPAFGRPLSIGGHQRAGLAAAFDVFVDEEFIKDETDGGKDTSRENSAKTTVQRTLRQRLDGGTAERLTRDPLRYMKNPSKLQSDQLKYDARLDDRGSAAEEEEKVNHSEGEFHKPEQPKSKAGHGGFDKQLLKVDVSGHDCCFEERRITDGYYKLKQVSPSYNFPLSKQDGKDQNNSSHMDVSESINDVSESIEEMDMGNCPKQTKEIDAEEIVVKLAAKSVLKSNLRHQSDAAGNKMIQDDVTTAVNPRRVLFGANTNVVYANDVSVNTSTECDGSFVKSEETINTKLANAEISMMFCSPNANASLAETPGKSLLSSSFNQPLFSTNSKKGDAGSSSAIHSDDKQESGGFNFLIYEEKTSTEDDKDCVVANGPSFAINDENKNESSRLNISNYKGDFKEKAEEKINYGKFAIPNENKKGSGGLGFSIFQDDADNGDIKPAQKSPRYCEEETASLSVIGNVMGGLGDAHKEKPDLGFGIYTDPEPSLEQTSFKTRHDHTSSSTYKASKVGVSKEMVCVAQDTASLSVVGGIGCILENCSLSENNQKSTSGFAIHSDETPTKSSRKEPQGLKIFVDENVSQGDMPSAGFEIFSKEVTELAQRKKQKFTSNNEPCFGDISRIEDEKTSNFQILDENAVPSKISRKENKVKVIDYASQHKEDMESTMRKCMVVASKSRHPYKIFDCRKKPLPKALVRKSFPSGTKIDLGGETVTIIHELGRGSYGVVLLCKDERGQSDALKIQAPIGSLAHEYSLLLRIKDRVEPDSSGFYPFPCSQALYAFAEGGLFSMTAGSDSGMTLIDVVNTYKKIMGNVPELVAIYYTSRMLKYLESLHQDGKVLHADIKPDNWVLTSSRKGIDIAGPGAIGGSDLMLVDFGRSIDLEKVTNRGSDPLRTQFKGNIAAKGMECGSMRKGMSWGVDLDFFGLAASSFVLLFGSHMEVIEDKRTGNWRLTKSFRRYWQKELWNQLFESLLNFDSSTDKYCLRDISVSFDEYIDGKQRKFEIATHISQLYTHLPRKR